jgi:hypothetical protein
LAIIARFATLNQIKNIFVLIFIGSMVFSIVASLPLLEEPFHKKMNHPKKAVSEGGDNEDETEKENDTASDLDLTTRLRLAELQPASFNYRNFLNPYSFLIEENFTPPPKV